ncbi:unnamed protein product [Urochloa decumbens]|uniref:Bifunctional inhibitor/plant lipid transfer protein/seed storage helical domain-containing protein n=1 Tax=Urochloa decumbens TaxID=240449 RepID=A0ABC9AWP0_9POAL
MQPQALAILLLVVCAMVSPHPVIGVKRGRCENEDKNRLLKACERFIKVGHAKESPHNHSPCCAAVHTVPGHDMQCIVDLLTEKERKEHEQASIMVLQEACDD